MGRKKVLDVMLDDVKEVKEEPIVEESKIGLFSLDFGREDLNKLKDKVNEIIVFLNK